MPELGAGWLRLGFLNRSLANKGGITLKVLTNQDPSLDLTNVSRRPTSAAELQGLGLPGGGDEELMSSWILGFSPTPTPGIQDLQLQKEYIYM